MASGRISPGPNGNNELFSELPLTVDINYASATGKANLVFQGDGNLVVYDESGVAVWAAATNGATSCILQEDGNFVVYHDDISVWTSNTAGSKNTLVVQDDGNVVIYDDKGNALWSTDTAH